MNAQRVSITYTAPSAFLASEHWKQVYAALLSQLPLRNLHWKSASRPAIQTIQELDVTFVSAEAKRDEHTSQIPQTVLEKPLLNAYFVVCDDSETYKGSVKKQIKDWHSSVTQKKGQEWLIIHIVKPDSKATGVKMFQIKSSVLDKLKADFNVEKRDRCVQLVWSYDHDNPTAWADLVNKVKDGVLSAFDFSVIQREEEVKRSESQRMMPGWNFCTFFILKESLANSFEGMNLHEEALETYNELETLFFHVLRDKNLSWFGALIAPGPNDDSLPLLSITKKPYRDLILANTISVFDFRVYLLARQCGLLSSLGRVVEIARKCVAFLSAFARRLRDLEDSLPPYFVESWSYSSALSVVDQCDQWIKVFNLDKTPFGFDAVKGELVEFARHQLDVLGIRAGHLPSEPPFAIALPTHRTLSSQPLSRGSKKISRTEIMASLQDKEIFYENYVNLTNRAIGLYQGAGRRKFALRLHADLAALDLHRGRLSNALQIFSSLPAHYAPHGWSSLEAYMLLRALTTHASAESPKDEAWIRLLLHFFKAYVQDLGKILLQEHPDQGASISQLVQSFTTAAKETPSDITEHDHLALSISIPDGSTKSAETRDGALLDVSVTNSLPCDLAIDEVSLYISGRDGSRLCFIGITSILHPGKNTVTLFCPSAAAGIYAPQKSIVKLSKLKFEWQFPQHSSTKGQRNRKPLTFVRVDKDVRAVDVRLRQPRQIELGRPSCIVVMISSGRNDISKATVRLSASSGITFRHKDAVLQGDGGSLDTTEDSIIVTDVGVGKTVLISVPHSDASAFRAIRVNIAAEYTTALEPDLERKLHLARIIPTTLPVAINVKDFFRGTRLFTRFSLSTPTGQHVRIRSVQLQSSKEDDDSLTITQSVSRSMSVTTITPTQTGHWLFQLDSTRGKEREPLRLQITFRLLSEEVEQLIESATQAVVTSSPSLELRRDILVDKLVRILENDLTWVERYETTGELLLPEDASIGEETEECLPQLRDVLRQRQDPLTNIGEWREIIIPVDVPQMHILAAARLRVLPNPFATEPSTWKLPALFAGQPISVMLTITTSFHWAPLEDADIDSYLLRYDIEEVTKDWLVSGRKRGDFIATDGATFTTHVTLIALHHGELSLPRIGVSALPLTGERRMKSPVVPSCETSQVHGAETVIVLPRGGRNTFVVNMGESI